MISKQLTAWFFPGQGSQHKGMGGQELFALFPELVRQADEILGYSIVDLCLNDPEKKLAQTEYSQPALFVVNALTFHKQESAGEMPDYFAGHSLGEYNALYAAKCFGFQEGLSLVQRRGEFMGQAKNGGMAAVIGLPEMEVTKLLNISGCDDLDIANMNSDVQIVVSGNLDDIRSLRTYCRENTYDGTQVRVVPLAVSAAFHSKYMQPAADAFTKELNKVQFSAPKVPVIANVTGDFYPHDDVKSMLSRQILSGVKWWSSLLNLRSLGVTNGVQVGPGKVMSDLWDKALKVPKNSLSKKSISSVLEVKTQAGSELKSRRDRSFCEKHGVKMPYLAGSMFRGIASTDLVIRMANAGLLSFFGAGGLTEHELENAIVTIQSSIGRNATYGMNLLGSIGRPGLEQRTVDLYLRYGVPYIEASAYTRVTQAIVEYRFKGARVEGGKAYAPNKVFAKVSRSEVARGFMQSPSEDILNQLYETGRLTSEEVQAAKRLPVSSDICVEADSGGHTDGGITLVLLPSIIRLRNIMKTELALDETVRIGSAGGIGSPEAVAVSFFIGAEFILVGSINQCTPQAGTSDIVKDLLVDVDIHDTAYAPAGDMFEIGARVQVVRRGTLFPARANQLHKLYQQYDKISSIPTSSINSIERFFGRSLDEVWESDRIHLKSSRPGELARLEKSEKSRMARVFKWYFSRSIQSAMSGNAPDKANFQIHCGPAMGAFNLFTRELGLQDWRDRNVDVIADELMGTAQQLLSNKTKLPFFKY